MNNKNINISLEEMKKIEIDILKKVDEICKKNDLKYSLMGGSLIGSIRHEGFIPWDDDIDIMMPRPDYEMLKEIMLKNPIEGLKYMSSDIQQDYHYPYAKIVSTKTTIKENKALAIKDYGVFIDVFPIDATYENKIKRFIQIKKIGILRNLLQISFYEEQISKNNIKRYLKKIISVFAKIVGFKRWTKIINKTMKKCDYDANKYVTVLYSDMAIKKGIVYEKRTLEDLCYKKFEGMDILVIKEYDKYLKDIFGDYMRLPPETERNSTHDFEKLMWK